MLINSSVFSRALEINVYDFVPGEVRIHSFSKNGCGIIRRTAVHGCKDTMRIVLAKNDADILARFHDDLTLNKTGETIHCSSGSSRCSMQNITDQLLPKLKMANLIPVGITLEEFKKAADMAKKEGVQLSQNGCATSNSSHSYVYRLFRDLGSIRPINAPVDALKLLNSDDHYLIYANDTFITFQSQTEIVYSNLYTKLVSNLDDFNPPAEGWIKIKDPEGFVNHMKYAAAFSDLVRLTVNGDVLALATDVVAQNPRKYSAEIRIESNLSKYCKAVDIENMLKCLGAIYPGRQDSIEIGVTNRMLKMENDNELAAVAIVKMLEDEEFELKEDGGTEDDRTDRTE